MIQICPAGLTPRTMFLVTFGKLPSAFAVPETFETGVDANSTLESNERVVGPHRQRSECGQSQRKKRYDFHGAPSW
jgi:hypothetical protein